MSLLHQEFIKVALKNKKRIAIYDQATKKDITYERLLLASIIVSGKVKKMSSDEHYVGVMVPNSAGCMISILAVLMAGKVPVMINYSTGADKNSIFAQKKCGFHTIISSKKLLDKLKVNPVDGMVFLEDIIQDIKLSEKLSAKLKTIIPSMINTEGSADDESVILFTSGSEKEPKAVQLSHKNLMSNIEGIDERFNVQKEEIFVGVLPLFHIFGLTTSFWLPLLKGAAVVAHANPLDYKFVAESAKKYQATYMIATPTFFNGYNLKSNPGDFSSVKVALAGADKVTDHLRAAILEKHNMKLYEGYGATETSPVISVNSPQDNKDGSIGKPLFNVKVKIVGLETDKEVKTGEQGKVLVKGDLVMNGYLGDLEETSVRIHNGWYDTGDIGTVDEDGYLWHKGRLKRFVKISGEMVSLVAVENALEKLIAVDCACCVVDVPHPTKGADIIAAVTTKLDAAEIRKKLAEYLPPIAIPKKFIIFEELPMMGSGKVNFREVTDLCRDKVEEDKKVKHEVKDIVIEKKDERKEDRRKTDVKGRRKDDN